MKMVGFIKQHDGKYKEYLPYNEQLSSDTHKRAIFLHMFNMYMDKTYTFTKQEIANCCSIEEAFRRKIMSEIDTSCIRVFKPISNKNIKIDVASSLLIHAYFMNIPCSYPLISKPFLHVGKLINLLYTPQGLSLMLDVEDMFLHLVYERIKKVNRNSEVLLHEKSIVIKHHREGMVNTLIIPSYKKLDKDHLHKDRNFMSQMNRVQETLNDGDISHVYLVYPKHPKFEKHINIRLPYQSNLVEDTYKVKVMPYSFSFCAKETRHKGRKRVKQRV